MPRLLAALHDNVTWPGASSYPGTLYEQYGDRPIIASGYPAMQTGSNTCSRYIVDDRMPRDTYGDWCVPPEDPS